MATNYLIAIGGTGERVMRALTHLCDCGHLDVNEIKLLIIDPDKDNGNCKSLKKILDTYSKCRKNFAAAGNPLFRTDIAKVLTGRNGANPEWAVSPVTGAPGQNGDNPYHLNDYVTFEGNADAMNFIKAIYSEEEYAEKDMNEGFFAHPSIGAHTFARWLDQSEEFGDVLTDIALNLQTGNVKVMIIGSAFGGTGASGFPAVARKIRTHVQGLKGTGGNEVFISGEFFLPYFTFLQVDEQNNPIGENSIQFGDFLKAAKNALSFYGDNNSADAFDRIYVLGAPSDNNVKIIRNFYADKGEAQDNWPHMLELFGALGVKEFFEMEDAALSLPDGTPRVPRWVGTGVARDDFYDIEWNDLPNSDNLKTLLNRFLLMSYIYIPSVLSHFMQNSGGQIRLKEFRDAKTFDPINRKPFSKGSLINNGWNDSSGGFAEEAFKRLLELNEYFHEHAQWFNRLLTVFSPDGNSGQLLFNHLLMGNVLNHRAQNAWHTTPYTDNIGQQMVVGGNFKYGDIIADIYQNVPREIHADKDVHAAIGELVRGVYKQMGKYIQ